MVHIYNMNDTDWMGAFNESNIMIGCRMERSDVAGGYSPYLFLNSAIGISHGREIQGQPKKYGRPNIEFRDDLIVGTVHRNGLDIFTGTLAYKQNRGKLPSPDEYFDFSTNINLKVIDHIDGHPALRQLTSRKITDLTVHECWSGPCTVELRPNAQAPLYRLPVVEMLTGFYWRADFTLVQGEIVYDYLEIGNR
jgi:acetoacetate decarboxylase